MAIGTSWSDPGAKQRGFTQPSFRGFPRRVSPYGQGISRYGSPTLPHGGGPYYGNQAQQLQQAGQDVMSGLAQAVTSYKKNKMYDALLQQEAPELAARYAAAGLTGEPAYQQYQDDMGGQRQDTRDYYTNRMNDLKIQAMQKALNQPGGIQPPVVDPKTGMIWNGRQWVRSAGVSGDRSLNAILAKNGMTVDDLADVDFTPGSVQYGAYGENDKFTPVTDTAAALRNPKDIFASGGGLPRDVPLADYLKMATRYKALGGALGGGQTATGGGQDQYQSGAWYGGQQFLGGDPNDDNSWFNPASD